MPVKGGRGVDGRSVDFRGSHGFKGERRGISRHQQSMKLRKLTANYLAMRRDHKNTTEPYKGIGSFYRDTTKILRLPPPPPPPVISVPTNFFSGSVASEKKEDVMIKCIPTIGPYRQKKSSGYAAKIGLWQIFQLSIFVFSREKCQHQSH